MSGIETLAPDPKVSFGRSGWMAISPDGIQPRIAVVAETEDEAMQKFTVSWRRWMKVLEIEWKPDDTVRMCPQCGRPLEKDD